jgi:hypothetical protein
LSFRRNRTFVAAWLTPLLVVVAALALPAVGQAAGTGGISGTVSGEGSGGLAGVEVCAEAVVGGGFECELTEAGGAYELPELPEGEYTVEFWASPQNFVRQFYSGATTQATATPVTVTAGGVTPGIDAVLEKGAKINGAVTVAATGQPAAGIFACAFGTTVSSFGCAETNASGIYSIVGLAGGQYEVFFESGPGQDLVSAPYSLGLVTVPAKGEKSGVNQALQHGGQISGTVRLAATNAPLAGVRVCLTEAEFLESLGCLTTPASGGYRFTGIWNGSFKVVFSAEASEIQDPAAKVDAYPTQWWQGAASFATATPMAITPPAVVSGVDAALGPPPAVVTPPTTVTTTTVTKAVTKPKSKPGSEAKSKPLKCRKGFVKRKVHGKPRCLRLHKAVRHKRHHKKKHA